MGSVQALAGQGVGATREECVAFVKRAVGYFETNGSKKALEAFNDPNGQFHDRDLYIAAFDETGACLANGQYPKLAGKNRINQLDANGVYYVRERIKLMQKQSKFWLKYRFPDPLTRTIVPKNSYCEVVKANGDLLGRL